MTGLRKARGTKDEGRRLMATQIDGVSALNKFAECPDGFNGNFFFFFELASESFYSNLRLGSPRLLSLTV